MVQPASSPRRRLYARLDEHDLRMMIVAPDAAAPTATLVGRRARGFSALQVALLLMIVATLLLMTRAFVSPASPAMVPYAAAVAARSVLANGSAVALGATEPTLSPSTRPLPPPVASAAVSSASGPSTFLGLPHVLSISDRQRIAVAANSQFALLASPSVSVGVIRSELQSVNSPLLGDTWPDHKDAAQYIWDAGYVDGVDPAILMAFFWHESHYGTQGIANQTDSVGNLRPLPNQPELNGYRYYRSWAEGVDDAYRLLRSYAVNGAPTVAAAIPVWAPPTDNNDDSAYIADVQQRAALLYAASVR